MFLGGEKIMLRKLLRLMQILSPDFINELIVNTFYSDLRP